MTTLISRPEHTLRQAFEEIDQANQLVEEQGHALERAQKRVDAAQALQDAAQTQLTNAEARYNVLAKTRELAAPEVEALRVELATREFQLSQVREQRETITAQRVTVERAQRDLRALFVQVRDLDEEVARAMDAMRLSVDEAQGISQVTPRASYIKTVSDRFGERHDELRGQRARYEPALARLEADIETLRAEVTFAADQEALAGREERLEREIAETRGRLEARQPEVDEDELRRAKADLKAAKSAAEVAPRAVLRAQAEHKAATDALARAQAQAQDAQTAFYTLEAQFVAEIQLSAPNAAGLITATAQFNQDLPSGYTLHWQAGGAAVTPETGDVVEIDTGQMPVGQTLIEAQIVRVSAVAQRSEIEGGM